jgi:hypothetical protein
MGMIMMLPSGHCLHGQATQPEPQDPANDVNHLHQEEAKISELPRLQIIDTKPLQEVYRALNGLRGRG